MDDIKAAGWTRFKPVAGQPITEKDMKKVFKMVDMDKSGAISQLVCPYLCVFIELLIQKSYLITILQLLGIEDGSQVSGQKICN